MKHKTVNNHNVGAGLLTFVLCFAFFWGEPDLYGDIRDLIRAKTYHCNQQVIK